MPSEFPPPLSTRVKVAAVIVLLVTLAYSFVIAGQILLWFVLVGIAAGIYIAWLLVVAVFRLVEAVERLAAAREAEVGGSDRTVEADAGSVGAGRTDAKRTDGDDAASEGTSRDAFEEGG